MKRKRVNCATSAFQIVTDEDQSPGLPKTSTVSRVLHPYQNAWRKYIQTSLARRGLKPQPEDPWSLPDMDLEEYKTALSPPQLLEVERNLGECRRLIKASKSGPVGGHMTRHERRFGRLNAAYANNQFAQMVKNGVSFTLLSLPTQRTVPYSRLKESERSKRVMMVKNWRSRGICRPISRTTYRESLEGKRTLHYILLFLVKKLGKEDYDKVDEETIVSKWRGCLSAIDLNEVMIAGKHKQHSSPEIDAGTPPGCWQARGDASDAYNQLGLSELPINIELWGLTSTVNMSCFNTHDPELATQAARLGAIADPSEYVGDEMLVMWFGAKVSPFIWQKIYSLPLGMLRRKGINFTTVMDDCKLVARDPLVLSRDLVTFFKAHVHYGVVTSAKEPDAIIPKMVEIFNGWLYDARRCAKFITQAKVDSICFSANRLIEARLASKPNTAKEMASALGKMKSAAGALFGVNLFCSGLQKDLCKTLKGAKNYYAKGTISDYTCQQLKWFVSGGFRKLNGRGMIHGHPVDQVLSTDWCSHGWGAVLEPTAAIPNPPVLSVPLPPEWQGVWSGWGETLVAMWALMSFAKMYDWAGVLVGMRLDNIAAICYLNQMGSPNYELNEFLWTLQQFLRRRCIMIVASYIPGAQIKADAPSRRRATLWDCGLAPAVLELLLDWLVRSDPALPWSSISFDLFATHANAKTEKFASLLPDPKATWIDCLAQSWTFHPPVSHLFYAFPPPNQAARLMQKIKQEKKTVLLILPAWARLAFVQIAEMLIKLPVLFPINHQTVVDPHRGVQAHFVGTSEAPIEAANSAWMLAGYLVSGDPCRLKAGRKELSELCSSSAQDLPSRLLTQFGPSGQHCAAASEWIQLMLKTHKSSVQ